MKRVILTGATGFIGNHAIAPLIERGYYVHAVSFQKSRIAMVPSVQWHRANLLDDKEASQLMAEISPTHMLHFAWYAEPRQFWHSPQNFLWLEASIALMRYFADFGGKRLVMAGTCAEYDWNYGYCSEILTPCKPTTPYGVCKNAMQETLQAFCAAKNLSGAWGRIFYLYGPGENPLRLIASVINSLLKGEKAHCTHGKQIRDFLHVQDVASAFVSLLDSPVEGPVNIASGQPVILREAVSLVADILNANQNIDFGSLAPPPNDPQLLVANNRRLLEEVKWAPHHTLQNGLKETVGWWKSQKGQS